MPGIRRHGEPDVAVGTGRDGGVVGVDSVPGDLTAISSTASVTGLIRPTRRSKSRVDGLYASPVYQRFPSDPAAIWPGLS